VADPGRTVQFPDTDNTSTTLQ